MDKDKLLVSIAHSLSNKGYKIEGYHADESDLMVDYYSPAYWEGKASKNGFDINLYNSKVIKGYQWSIEKDNNAYAVGSSITDVNKIIEAIEKVVNDKNALPMKKVISQKVKSVKVLKEVDRKENLQIDDVMRDNSGSLVQVIEINEKNNSIITVKLGAKSNGYKQRKHNWETTLNNWNAQQVNNALCVRKLDKVYNIVDDEEVTEVIKYKKATKKINKQIEEVKETETAPKVENNNDDITVSFNEEKNGIEIKFNCKPSEEVRAELKKKGFQWSPYKKIWWAKDSEQRREFLINKGYLVIKEENKNNEHVETITTESTSEPTEQISEVFKNEVLNTINSSPYFTTEANSNMQKNKTFAVIRLHDNSLEKFLKNEKEVQKEVNFYKKVSNKQEVIIIEINKNELCDINDKKLWDRHMTHLIKSGFKLDKTTVDPEKYCTNKATIDYVKKEMNRINCNSNKIDYSKLIDNCITSLINNDTFINAVKSICDNEEEKESFIDSIIEKFMEIKSVTLDTLNKLQNDNNKLELYTQLTYYYTNYIVNLVNKINLAIKNNNTGICCNMLTGVSEEVQKQYKKIVEKEKKLYDTLRQKTFHIRMKDTKLINSKEEKNKIIETIPDVSSSTLEPEKKIFINCVEDNNDKHALFIKCCITKLKVYKYNEFIEVMNNLDKFNFENSKTILDNIEYNNAVCIYNQDTNQVRLIVNNKALFVYMQVRGNILNLIRPYQIAKEKRLPKIDFTIKKEKNNNCITPEVVEPEKTIIEEEKKEIKQAGSDKKQNIKELTEPAQKNYESLINENIKKYSISEELNRRVNSVSFMVSDRDYNKDLKGFLNGCKDEVLKVINMTDDAIMKDRILNYINYFNKKYFENYTRILNHKANNPSWVVTGRGGLNKRKYDKALSRYDNLLLDNSNLVDSFNNKISKFRNDIKRTKRQEINNKIDSFTKTSDIKIKFEKVKVKICCSNVTDIFNNGTYEVTAYKYDNYYIIKNWGCWRIYNSQGNEIKVSRTNTTLKAAKEYLTYVLSNAA